MTRHENTESGRRIESSDRKGRRVAAPLLIPVQFLSLELFKRNDWKQDSFAVTQKWPHAEKATRGETSAVVVGCQISGHRTRMDLQLGDQGLICGFSVRQHYFACF
jgi:hypothetical protein